MVERSQQAGKPATTIQPVSIAGMSRVEPDWLIYQATRKELNRLNFRQTAAFWPHAAGTRSFEFILSVRTQFSQSCTPPLPMFDAFGFLRIAHCWRAAIVSSRSACGTRMIGVVPFNLRIRPTGRSEEHTSELQSRRDLVCR